MRAYRLDLGFLHHNQSDHAICLRWGPSGSYARRWVSGRRSPIGQERPNHLPAEQ
jgi:hypothetical protein